MFRLHVSYELLYLYTHNTYILVYMYHVWCVYTLEGYYIYMYIYVQNAIVKDYREIKY